MSIIKPKFRISWLVLFSALLSVVYCFFYSEKPSRFISFSHLNWASLENCRIEESAAIDGTSRSVTGKIGEQFLKCLSEPFKIEAKVLRLHYLIKSSAGQSSFLFQIKDMKGNTFVERELKEHVQHSQVWVPLFISIPEVLLGENVQLLISEKWRKHEGDEFYLRDRVDFYDKSPEAYQLFGIPELNNVLLKSFVLAVILTSLFVVVYLMPPGNNLLYWCVALWAISLQFFSFKPYYYFDEWHVIQRFSEMGLAGVWHVHNEHFIPLFFSWYFFITKIFGENYTALQFISLLLHALHAVVLNRVLVSCSVSIRVARALSLLFSLSALHVEVLEWAFEQCIIICSILGLLALNFALQYLKECKKRSLAYATILCCILPLFFGNGFVWGPMLVSLTLAFVIFRIKFSRKLLSRYTALTISITLALLVPLSLYLWNKPESPVEAASTSSKQMIFENMDTIIYYMIVGSGLGSGLRAIGLYPNLTLSPAYEGMQLLAPQLSNFIVESLVWKDTSLEVFLGSIGLFLLAIIGVSFLKKDRICETFFFIKAGFIILILSFLLPAIGRWNLGELQSLALRYQYQALLGTVFLLVPLFSHVEMKLFSLSRGGIFKSFFSVSLLCTILVWFMIQTFLVNNFTYFRHLGEVHRSYTDELLDWDLRANVLEVGKPYEGSGELKGLFPVHLPSITPGTHPTFILKTKKEYLQ